MQIIDIKQVPFLADIHHVLTADETFALGVKLPPMPHARPDTYIKVRDNNEILVY